MRINDPFFPPLPSYVFDDGVTFVTQGEFAYGRGGEDRGGRAGCGDGGGGGGGGMTIKEANRLNE